MTLVYSLIVEKVLKKRVLFSLLDYLYKPGLNLFKVVSYKRDEFSEVFRDCEIQEVQT